MSQTLTLRKHRAVAWVSFCRPERLNAVNVEMAEAFERVVEEIISDATLRVVVWQAEGRAFMAGGDLAEFGPDKVMPDAADRLIQPMHRALLRLRQGPQIVVASVHGAVAGAGFSLCLLADLVIAARSARFNMAYARIGASPDCGGSWGLSRLVGYRKAVELTLLSDILDSDAAMTLNLVNRVVEDADLPAETEALAARLAAVPPVAAQSIRALLDAAATNPLEEHLDAEAAAFRRCSVTPEFTAAIAAFTSPSRGRG